jgi:hypothetical protein
MGQGTYFAEDPAYSHIYAYRIPDSPLFQMFLCVVNLGRYKAYSNTDDTLRVPPLIEGSQTIRYDSTYNRPQKHFIVYDNAKAYPGYLITYRCDAHEAL